VTLQDPLLLILAEHRSFREDDSPSTTKMGTIQKLTTHVQIENNVKKEETKDKNCVN
jgi:hypothetical protein